MSITLSGNKSGTVRNEQGNAHCFDPFAELEELIRDTFFRLSSNDHRDGLIDNSPVILSTPRKDKLAEILLRRCVSPKL